VKCALSFFLATNYNKFSLGKSMGTCLSNKS
jgi:hypothetical protein